MQTRTFDGAVLYIGSPFPGSSHDSTDPPPNVRPRLTDKAYVGYPGAIHPAKASAAHPLSSDVQRRNRLLSTYRTVDEPVHGRLKNMFPRLRFWRGSLQDPSLLRAAWLFASMYHNIYISQMPMVVPGSRWDWLLGRAIPLPSSDIWPGTNVPIMRFSGSEFDYGMCLE
jgi:hypothetical protein